MKIYCVHPISGMNVDEVFNYYTRTRDTLEDMGYTALIPMTGKGSLRTEMKFKASGYKDDPLTTNNAIFDRDRWMVGQADILYANLLGTDRVSIGSCFELAWGSDLHKQIILVMESDNIHRHAFVLQAATIIFEEEATALTYLSDLHKNIL